MDTYILAMLCILIGFSLFVLGWRGRTSLPRGRVTYVDSNSLERSPETLYDPMNDLAGRPDYIIHASHGVIPVEIKSAQAPDQPYEGHILQLAAYCQLIEATTGHRPSYGVISYRDQSFRIRYTTALQRALAVLLQEIRSMGEEIPQRSHNQVGRCRACGYRSTCEQAL